MDTPLTAQDMRRMAQEDLPRLRDRFLQTLRLGHATRPPMSTKALNAEMRESIEILKATGLALSDLGVDAEDRPLRTDLGKTTLAGRNLYWDQLCICMIRAPVEDALVVFRSLVDAIKDYPSSNHVTLIKVALCQPHWCLKAIESQSGFSLAQRLNTVTTELVLKSMRFKSWPR